jgi:hypothetical protein
VVEDAGVELLRVQRDVCRRLGVAPLLPEPGTMIGIAPSRGQGVQPLNALRHPPQGQSNGWYVWRGGAIPRDQDDFFVPSHVEHLVDRVPELVPYLALPPGWGVVLAPDYEDLWYDAGPLDV